MTETDTNPAIPDSPYGAVDYSVYWKAWGALLALTLMMAFISSPGFIVAGIVAKVTIIMAWFMHLKEEKLDFVLYVVVSLFFFAWLLYYLMIPDARAM